MIRSVQAGVSTAETKFWQRHSAPLIEAVPDDSTQSLVTFVFRAEAEAQNVIVITPLSLVDFSASLMTRIPGTSTWYRTYTLSDSVRFLYRFGIDDNLLPFDQDRNLFARMGTWIPDPANPRRFSFGDGSEGSILELPLAQSESWIHPRSGEGGTMEESLLLSDILEGKRAVGVYLPPGFSREKPPYPLVVFHDGDSYQGLIPAPTILDNLIAEGRIPPTVAVFLPASANRGEEYDCNPRWGRLVASEIVPWARERYHAGLEASRTFVVGFSLGGLAAACTAHQHPDVFGGVLAQSGSFYRAPAGEAPEWLSRSIAAGERSSIRWYLEIGSYERSAIPSRDPSMLTASRHLRDVLLAKGVMLRYEERPTGHEHVAWRASLAPALVWLLTP
ncbi:MAG TPA: alpha/beta hydrolase-fold protein [Gemmatimonadota bacterium]|nr:alpha/beta hydrolase-fold protein [Gemmatimonadota bacterium]